MRPYQLRSLYETLGSVNRILRVANWIGIAITLAYPTVVVIVQILWGDTRGLDAFMIIAGMAMMLAIVTPYCLATYIALQEWETLPKRAFGFLAGSALFHLVALPLLNIRPFISWSAFAIFTMMVLLPTLSALSIYVRQRIVETGFAKREEG